jgi:hypothetical protein
MTHFRAERPSSASGISNDRLVVATIHVGARATSPHFNISICFDDKGGQGRPRRRPADRTKQQSKRQNRYIFELAAMI